MIHKLALVIIVSICSTASYAASQFNINISSGYERLSSPLVRIDPEKPLIAVEGRSKLQGQYYQLSASGVNDWEIDDNYSIGISGNVNVLDAPKAQDLNFGIVSSDVTLRKKFLGGSFGIGPSVQRIWIANEVFRDNITLQTDLTYTNLDGGFTDIFFAVSKNTHVEDFNFFDNKAATISLTHHHKQVPLGFNALDIQLSASRQKNVREADDLSNYSYYARASLDREMLGLTCSVGASITKSYFDAPFFDGFAKRRDAYVSYEFGIERKFTDKLNMNLDVNLAENKSNLVLFESDFRVVSVSLNYNF